MSRRCGGFGWATVWVAMGLLAAWLVCLHPVWVGTETVRLAIWRAGVKSEWVDVDGNRIHYYEALPRGAGLANTGPENAEPVVLVHGLGGRSEDWVKFMPALAAKGYHVYAPDLLGYGRSARPAEASYSISQEEDVVRQFMASQGIAQADVLGWSMGGWITLKLALDDPQRVRRVMLVDAAGIYLHPPVSLSLFTPHSVEEVQELFHYLEAGDRKLPWLVARDALTGMERNGWVAQRSTLSMMSGTDLLDFRLHKLRQPTLILWGAQDRLTTVDTGRRMHALISKSEMVELQGCGHLVPLECSGRALPVVENFLAEPVTARQ